MYICVISGLNEFFQSNAIFFCCCLKTTNLKCYNLSGESQINSQGKKDNQSLIIKSTTVAVRHACIAYLVSIMEYIHKNCKGKGSCVN